MKSKTYKIPVTVALIALIISIALLVITYFSWIHLEDAKKESFINNAQSHYRIDKLEFCLNHTITPCDDSSIITWNEAHKTEQFSLQTFQQLVEQGISDSNTSRK